MNTDLVGKSYTFEDGNVIKIIQIKDRDYKESIVPFVTYIIYQGSNLPRKLVMPLTEFMNTYSHLFDS